MLVQLGHLSLVVCAELWGARVAAADSLNKVGADAAAGDDGAAPLEHLAGQSAGVDLVSAADTAPAKVVVVVGEALDGAHSALIMEQDAREELHVGVGWEWEWEWGVSTGLGDCSGTTGGTAAVAPPATAP